MTRNLTPAALMIASALCATSLPAAARLNAAEPVQQTSITEDEEWPAPGFVRLAFNPQLAPPKANNPLNLSR